MWVPTIKDIQQMAKHPRKLVTIKEDATAAQAAKKMTDNQVGCLVVFDVHDRFAGVLSERDMLKKVLTELLAPKDLLVKQIMTTQPISCTGETTIEQVEQLMAEHQIRHVPVVANGVPVGMVSSRDVIAYQLLSSKAMKTAAEQLALLSTELKSLNLKDVIALAVNETPKSLGANRAVLCFPPANPSDLVIYRSNCKLSRTHLLDPAKMEELVENSQAVYSEICNQCADCGGESPRLTIPLNIHDQSDAQSNNDRAKQGFLCVCKFEPSPRGWEKLLLYKASLLQEILSVNLTNAKLYHNYQKARQESEIDPLTGVGSRRVLEQVLNTEYERALRYNHCFSIAIVDMDNFKEINDTAGHAAGDRALRQLTKIMHRNARTTDVITRYGGDEFVLLMPETKLNEATVLLERLRRQVRSISAPCTGPLTVSCGVAEWLGTPTDSAKQILKRADAALYEAKRAGRNRIVASPPPAKNIRQQHPLPPN